jgi:hypothetical protein
MLDRDELLNDTETALRTALDGRQATMWTAIPAIVVSFNPTEMTLIAQPTIQAIVTASDGTETPIPLPVLVDVPVCFPQAGGFLLTLPIAVGDEVLVIFASRCIDSWWQSAAVGPPMELRMHDLSDGFAIPGPRSQPKAALVSPPPSTTSAQLRNLTGTCYLEITPAGAINLVAPTGLGITGNVSVTGTLTATGEIMGAGIPLSVHTHPVTTAPGETGAPVP